MMTPQPMTVTTPGQTGDFDFTTEMLELELTLENMSPGFDGFADRVRAAARGLNGAYLFDLPASGLIEDCVRIAVLQIPRDAGGVIETVLACLEPGGGIRIEKPDERTAGLASFAQAFVDVFQRM